MKIEMDIDKETMRKINPEFEFIRSGMMACDNPFNKSEIKDKRFYRYIDKIEKNIANKISNIGDNCGNGKYTLYHIGLHIVFHKLTDVYYDQIKDQIDQEKVMDKNEKYGLHQIVILPKYITTYYQPDKYKFIEKYICDRLLEFYNDETYDSELINISESVFNDAVTAFLSRNYIYENITTVNYMTNLPDDTDLNCILVDYVSLLYVRVLMYYIEKIVSNKLEIKEKELDDIHNTISTLTDENRKLKATLAKEKLRYKDVDELIDRLKIEAEEGTKSQQELFNSAITEKDREIRRLEKQIESLKNKQHNNTIVEEPDIIEEEIIECDTSLNYVFVMTKWSVQFEQQLLEAFPNATIMNSSDNWTDNIDLLVFITTHLKHNMYYKIKNTCKNNNIPFIHFSSTNIDLLKTEIAKKMR
jgi:hypothetical protein